MKIKSFQDEELKIEIMINVKIVNTILPKSKIMPQFA